jgi:hypothetical protein
MRNAAAAAFRLLALAGLGAFGVACGVEPADPASIDNAVEVRPRVVLDGLLELYAREQGNLNIAEVVFFAPEVAHALEVPGGHSARGSVDAEPLVFRYVSGSTDGFGDVLGAPRTWQLPQVGDLQVMFAPAPSATIDELSEETGIQLAPLVRQTAYVRGSVSVPDGTVRGFADSGSVDGGSADSGSADSGSDDSGSDDSGSDDSGERGETDPDTSPADSADSADGDVDDEDGASSEGDPDTSPADEEAESDPDTSPADGSGDGQNAAESDPDTSPADGDPDTSPASGMEGNAARRADDRPPTEKLTLAGRPSMTTVPFLFVLDGSFTVSRSLADLNLERLAPDDVLPIDLHVNLNELLNTARLNELDKRVHQATLQGSGQPIVLEAQVGSAVNLTIEASAAVKIRPTRGGIRVVGDHRERRTDWHADRRADVSGAALVPHHVHVMRCHDSFDLAVLHARSGSLRRRPATTTRLRGRIGASACHTERAARGTRGEEAVAASGPQVSRARWARAQIGTAGRMCRRRGRAQHRERPLCAHPVSR